VRAARRARGNRVPAWHAGASGRRRLDAKSRESGVFARGAPLAPCLSREIRSREIAVQAKTPRRPRAPCGRAVPPLRAVQRATVPPRRRHVNAASSRTSPPVRFHPSTAA
jgi:hypothetical protein